MAILEVAPPVDSVGDLEELDLAVQGEPLHLRHLGLVLVGPLSAGIPVVGYFEL